LGENSPNLVTLPTFLGYFFSTAKVIF
jgi:hypothetical protein